MAEKRDPTNSPTPNGNGGRKPLPFIIVGVLILIGAIYGYRIYSFNQTHASTDDAQVVADSVEVSPQVGGTVAKVLVADNQLVKKGDLLITIDDRSLKANLDQANANYDAAVAAAQGAGVNISLAQQTGSAQVQQAEGIVKQAQAGIQSAQSDVSKSQAGIASARASEGVAQANVVAAQSGVAGAQAASAKAKAALKGAQATVASARAQVKVADAAVSTAQSNADVVTKDAARYQTLLAQGAVSQQEADAKQAAADSANSNLEGAKQQADAARALLGQREAEVTSAREGVTAAEAGVQSAHAAVAASRSQKAGSAAGYLSALAQQRASEDAVRNARAKAAQAEGQLAQANTAGATVDVKKTAKLQAVAKVAQAKAAVEEATLQLSYTQVFAPRNGRITKKNVDAGQQVSIGAPILTIVDESDIWVVANYKETQLPGIAVGKKVDIEVDAISKETLHGTVNSLQAGTGAAFTLLPPDNATGNFTKVVQRVPVKIVFDPGQPGLDQLRSGMSASTVVILSGS